MDVFVFFSRKNRRCSVCITVSFFAKKKNTNLARRALASLVQSFNWTKVSLPG